MFENSSAKDAAEMWRYAAKRTDTSLPPEVEAMLAERSAAANKRFVAGDVVYYRGKDGVNVPAWVFRVVDEGPYAVVVAGKICNDATEGDLQPRTAPSPSPRKTKKQRLE